MQSRTEQILLRTAVRGAEQRWDCCVRGEELGAGGGDMVLWRCRTVLGGVSGGRLMLRSSTMRGGVISLCWRRVESSGGGGMGPVSGWGERVVAGPTRCRGRLGLTAN